MLIVCSPFGHTDEKVPVPVGLFESAVSERLYLGFAAPGPGRARRDATPHRDAGGSRGANLPTGLVAPAFDGFSLSYHRQAIKSEAIEVVKLKYLWERYFI